MARVFSGIKPTGKVHLGNYLGAFSRWAAEQQPEHVFCVVDLHAMTVAYDPEELRTRTLDLAAWLLAAGLDPETCTLFVQSHVREHAELAWFLTCAATTGELSRMTQYKEKSGGQSSVPAGIFSYPVLMAADILLHHAEEVPVGDDQRQHVELTRDIAQRFNHRYGETFTIPKATVPTAGARIMDLQFPDRKMSKSADSPQGTIDLDEPAGRTRKKIMRAVTDSGSEVRAAADKPGVTNLLDMLAAVAGRSVEDLEAHFAGAGYGDLKKEVAAAVNDALAPVRERREELLAHPDRIHEALAAGADRARTTAVETMAAVRERAGLLT